MRHSICRRPRFAQCVLLVAQHNYTYAAVNLARTCDLTGSKSKQGYIYIYIDESKEEIIPISLCAFLRSSLHRADFSIWWQVQTSGHLVLCASFPTVLVSEQLVASCSVAFLCFDCPVACHGLFDRSGRCAE